MSVFSNLLIANASEIPGAYRKVDFLRSDGTAYIDTGFIIPENGATFDTDFQTVSAGVSGVTIFGSRSQVSPYPGFIGLYILREFRYASYIGTTIAGYGNVTVGAMSTVKVSVSHGDAYDLGVIYNGTAYSARSSTSYVQSGCPVYLFALNNANAPAFIDSSTNIYYFAITDPTGVKVADLVPCVRKSDNAPGMWDKVGKRFLTNAAASGTFIYE